MPYDLRSIPLESAGNPEIGITAVSPQIAQFLPQSADKRNTGRGFKPLR
jgi:hypothetical protein